MPGPAPPRVQRHGTGSAEPPTGLPLTVGTIRANQSEADACKPSLLCLASLIFLSFFTTFTQLRFQHSKAQMALTLVHKTMASALKLEDLQRYPSSSLAAMVSSVSLQDGPVTLQLDELTDSPLAEWPEAVSITAALYRGNHQSLMVSLSELLQRQSTAEVYAKFKSLAEYLGLPGSVFKLLPPLETATIKQLPVLDLHYYALADEAVQLMINSNAFTSTGGLNAQKVRAAFFFLSTAEDKGRLEGIKVYAVGGGKLADPTHVPKSWPLGLQTVAGGKAVVPNFNVGSAHAKLLGGTASAVAVKLFCLGGFDATQGISAEHPCFGQHIEALLKAAAGSIRVGGHGSKAVVQAACFRAQANATHAPFEGRSINLWAIHW